MFWRFRSGVPCVPAKVFFPRALSVQTIPPIPPIPANRYCGIPCGVQILPTSAEFAGVATVIAWMQGLFASLRTAAALQEQLHGIAESEARSGDWQAKKDVASWSATPAHPCLTRIASGVHAAPCLLHRQSRELTLHAIDMQQYQWHICAHGRGRADLEYYGKIPGHELIGCHLSATSATAVGASRHPSPSCADCIASRCVQGCVGWAVAWLVSGSLDGQKRYVWRADGRGDAWYCVRIGKALEPP
jgi:hypothetical protein